MKIGIDAHNLEGRRTGMGRYLMNLLKYWADTEPEFILYFKNNVPGDIPKSGNFRTRILKIESNALFEHFLLPKAIKKDKIDLFFSPSYILPLKISKKIMTAVAVHDVSYAAHPEWFSWQNRILLRRISKKSAQKADIIFTPSEFTKKEILKHYKIQAEKIFVVPLAAADKFRQLDKESKTIKEKYGIQEKFIFYIGAIFNRRFIPECIEAFKQIAKNFPEYQFLISGINYTHPFVDIDYIIKKANKDIGREAIIRTEYAEEKDLIYLYNSADLFIWLSSYEGFGLPPLEALACGTPVITTKMGSLAEAVGESAIFVNNPENTQEIIKAMERVLSDKQLANELSKKGLKQAEKFSWQKTADVIRVLFCASRTSATKPARWKHCAIAERRS